MKTKVKISLLCVCMFSFLFCFTGCDFGFIHFETNTPQGEFVRHTNDDDLQQGERVPPQNDNFDDPTSVLFEDGTMDEYIDVWHGVRTVYDPSSENYLSITNQTLLAQRQKFNQNATDQYYYFAWYVLTALVDNFGVPVGNQTKTYTFYTGGKEGSAPINYSQVAFLRQEMRIEGKVSGSFDDTKKWNFSLSTHDETEYYENYIHAFTNYLQIRFLEVVLGLSKTEINTIVDLSTGAIYETEINAKLANYAQKIEKLGIANKKSDFIALILDEVIGQNEFLSQVSSIVDDFMNSIAPTFASYSRTEVADISAGAFFNVGTRGNPAKLPNMEYAEYQSASFYYKDGQEPKANTIFQVYIDSRRDMVLDVYALYTKESGTSRVEFLGTLHTDSTKDFCYKPLGETEELDLNTEITNNNDFVLYPEATKQQIEDDAFLNVYLNYESENFGTQGYANPLSAADGQTVCQLVSYVGDANLHSLSQPVLKNGEEVDLSDIKFYADLTKDGIVLLFDIQYENGGTTTNHQGDYSFKFLNLPEGLAREDSEEMYAE